MWIPDIAENLPPMRRWSLKTGKEMNPQLWCWCFCDCGAYHAAPLQARGTLAPGKCPLCGRKR